MLEYWTWKIRDVYLANGTKNPLIRIGTSILDIKHIQIGIYCIYLQ